MVLTKTAGKNKSFILSHAISNLSLRLKYSDVWGGLAQAYQSKIVTISEERYRNYQLDTTRWIPK